MNWIGAGIAIAAVVAVFGPFWWAEWKGCREHTGE
jgi:hypothetical protein